MSFAIAGLKRVSHIGAIGTGGSSVRSLWSYITNDDAATVETANYFDTVLAEMRLGDMILASLDIDGTPKPAMYVVSGISGGHVTITGAVVA